MTERKGGLILIAAVAENGVIGLDGGLPWRLKGDLKHFREATMGHGVIMGRKTAESLESARVFPLDGRFNAIWSRTKDYGGVWPNTISSGSLDFLIGHARRFSPDGIAYVSGGGEVYAATIYLPETIGLNITRAHQSPDGDTFFPRGYEDRFRLVKTEPHLNLGYTFEEWERVG